MNHNKCNLQAAKIILKVNSEIIWLMCWICLKLTINKPQWCQWRRTSAFTDKFIINDLLGANNRLKLTSTTPMTSLMFLLLTLNKFHTLF